MLAFKYPLECDDMKKSNVSLKDKCGNDLSGRLQALPATVIERMKLVFRATHGTDMGQEDRNYLGIPPCVGDCCTFVEVPDKS